MNENTINRNDIAFIECWIHTLSLRYCHYPSPEIAKHLCHYLGLLLDNCQAEVSPARHIAYCKMQRFWQWRLAQVK